MRVHQSFVGKRSVALPVEGDEAKPDQKKIPLAPRNLTIDPVYIKPDPTKVPKPGCLRGEIWMAEDFDSRRNV
jgi:hypothetical protein